MPTQKRCAGCLPASGSSEGIREWVKRNSIMTAEEAKQRERAITAFLESVGGRSFIPPVVLVIEWITIESPTLDLDLVDDWIDI